MKTSIIDSLKDLKGYPNPIGFDVESHGSDSSPHVDSIATMQFYIPEDDTCLIYPIHTKQAEETPDQYKVCQEVLPTLKTIGHYLQYDHTSCVTHYRVQPEPFADTYLLACTLQWSQKKLKPIAAVLVPDSPTIPIESVVDLNNIEWDLTDQRQLDYMAGDPYKAYKVYQYLLDKGIFERVKKAHRIDIKALRAYCQSRSRGMQVNTQTYHDVMRTVTQQVEELDAKFQSLIPRPCKAGSPKDLQRLYFLDLGLPPTPVTTQTGAPSTSTEALQYLVDAHPSVPVLLDLKHAISVQSGAKKFPTYWTEKERVHPKVLQVGEDGTSRVYNSGPSTNQLSREMRECIVPDPGKKFLYFDWSAAELVLAAYWAGCVDMLEVYESGEDLHAYNAKRILKKDEITKEERDQIKRVIFSTLFGSEGDAAARTLMISREQAASYVQEFFSQYPDIANLKAKIEQRCAKSTYTYTIYGRPRKLPEAKSDSPVKFRHAMRQAFNTAIQGSVADLQKIAVGRLHEYLDQGFEFVTGVFDSILIQVPEEMTEETFLPVIDKLSTFGDLKLHYKWATGHTWKEVQDKT